MKKFKKLSRAEMRKIGGGVSGACPCKDECTTNDNCPGNSDCEGPPVTCSTGNGCTYKICSGKI